MTGAPDELDALRQANADLRALASELAAAATTDEVAQTICTHAAPVLGCDAVQLGIARGDVSGSYAAYIPESSNSAGVWETVSTNERTPLTDAIQTNEQLVVAGAAEIDRRFPDSAPTPLAALAGRQIAHRTVGGVERIAALVLEWDSPPGSVEHALGEEVAALCGSVLERALIGDDLATTTALLDSFLQNAPIGLGFFDQDLRFAMLNERLAEINGQSIEAHIGKAVDDMVPDLSDAVREELRTVLDSGRPVIDSIVHGTTPAAPDDPRVWRVSYYPVTGGDRAAPLGVGAVVDDITDEQHYVDTIDELHREQRTIASQLQLALVPALPQIAGFEVAASYEPSEDGMIIGGDWYDVVKVGDDDIAFVIGDAVGHDLNAAVSMSRVRHALIGLSHAQTGPEEVISSLDGLADHQPDLLGTTVFYARVQPSTGAVTYACAGHHAPLLVDEAGVARRLDEATGPPIGVSAARPTAVVSMPPRSALIGFTDGLVEHRRRSIDKGVDVLLSVAAPAVATQGMSARALLDEIVDRVPERPHEDDLAVIVLRRLRSESSNGRHRRRNRHVDAQATVVERRVDCIGQFRHDQQPTAADPRPATATCRLSEGPTRTNRRTTSKSSSTVAMCSTTSSPVPCSSELVSSSLTARATSSARPDPSERSARARAERRAEDKSALPLTTMGLSSVSGGCSVIMAT